MVDALATAEHRALTAADHRRCESYVGTAKDLHDLVAAIPPLSRPRWWAAALVAQHGTPMTLGYLALPHPNGLGVGFACLAPDRIIGPLGPAVVTTTHMQRPDACTDESWRELRAAAGIVLRALLLDLGTPTED